MEYIKNDKKNVANVQLSTVNERISMGTKLYVAAWIFEIVAATIGLFVAYFQSWDSYVSFNSAEGGILPEQLADVVLGGLPFIMVALAEVLKVPIVYLVYINRNIITKAFFSAILLGLTFITFETVSSGFERQFSNITSKVQKPAEELRLTQEKILSLKEKVKTTSAVTSKTLSDDLSQIKLNLEKSYTADIDALDKQILDLLESNNVSLVNDIKEETLNLTDLKNGKKEEIVTTESGLQYEVLTEGKGERPGPTSKVTTHYHGTTIDGNVFDSSVDRGEPIQFPVNGVIPGWTEALQLMPVGSKWRLFIPSDLAYGPRGSGDKIPPHAALIFEVELISIDS